MKATKILVISIAFLFAFVSTVGAFQNYQVRKPGNRTFPNPTIGYQVFNDVELVNGASVTSNAINMSELKADTTDMSILVAFANTTTAVTGKISLTYLVSADGLSYSRPTYHATPPLLHPSVTIGPGDARTNGIDEQVDGPNTDSNNTWAMSDGGYGGVGAQVAWVGATYNPTQTVFMTCTAIQKAPFIKVRAWGSGSAVAIFDMWLIGQ